MTIQNHLDILRNSIKANSSKAALKAAEAWRVGIYEVLTNVGTGRIYSRKGKLHRASKPGDPPALDTGKLRDSYKTKVISATEVQVGSDLDYAEMLEKGTSRILPRPHILPGYERKRKEIQDALNEEWKT